MEREEQEKQRVWEERIKQDDVRKKQLETWRKEWEQYKKSEK